MSPNNGGKYRRALGAERWLIACAVVALCAVVLAQPSKAPLTGRYEGTAKNKAEETITVAFELTEKDGALSGMIRSSHGDFPITGGSHKDDAVILEFDAGGATGTISVKISGDQMSGTWNAGEDGGAVEVKKVSAESGAKGKS